MKGHLRPRGTMCKGRAVSMSLTISVTKEAIQVRSLKSWAPIQPQPRIFSHSQVSLHSLGCDFYNKEACSMSAVKIGSIFIIKSIMLPLKPDHVSLETPSYIKEPWPVIGKKAHHLWKPL